MRQKRQIAIVELYEAMFLPENVIRGIHPKGGQLANSQICNCGVPSGKLRKEIKTKVAWQEDMWDPASDSFYQVKTMVEEKVTKKCDGITGCLSFLVFFI
jgi:hypothetical protein